MSHVVVHTYFYLGGIRRWQSGLACKERERERERETESENPKLVEHHKVHFYSIHIYWQCYRKAK
jgi:hypothetical protein